MDEHQQFVLFEMIKRLGRSHWILLKEVAEFQYPGFLTNVSAEKMRLHYLSYHVKGEAGVKDGKKMSALKDPNCMYSFVNNEQFLAMERALNERIPVRFQDTPKDKRIKNFKFHEWCHEFPHKAWDTKFVELTKKTFKQNSHYNNMEIDRDTKLAAKDESSEDDERAALQIDPVELMHSATGDIAMEIFGKIRGK